MEKELFEKAFKDSLDKNFPNRSKYFEFEFVVFSELGGNIFEINKCLILEFYRASITLTNNLLERLLKLALIYDEVGIKPISAELWTSAFEEPYRKYSSIPLGNSIEKCKKLNLITSNEKVYLFDTIRNLMRNGFSHADSTKILQGIPDEITMMQVSISNPTDQKPVTVNQKKIPFIEALHVENFAKDNASKYFEYVYDLIGKIEQRIIEK
jgi:hypothetical protein